MRLTKTFDCPACGKETDVKFFEVRRQCEHCNAVLDIIGDHTRLFGALYVIFGLLLVISVSRDSVEKMILPWFVENRPDLLVGYYKKFTVDLISALVFLSVSFLSLFIIAFFEFNHATEVREMTKPPEKEKMILSFIFVVLLVLFSIFTTVVKR